jgi:CHAT domain-containing protein
VTGESHSYLIKLDAGQFLHATIMQVHGDLTAMLFGPDGQQVGQFDGRWRGPEPVCFVAEVSGNYRLAIRPFYQNAARESYQVRIDELRAPTPQDQIRVTALKASTEGKQLIQKGTAESLKLAKGKYEEALLLWRTIGDRFAEAQTLNSLGFLVSLAGPMKALEYFNQALAIRQEIKDRNGEGETLNNIAAMHSALGKKEQALEYYNRALPLRRASGDRTGEAETLGNIGLMYFSLGDPQKAIEHYNQAVPLWRAAGNRAGEVNALISLGSVHRMLGENQQALDYLHRGLQIAGEANDRRGAAYALNFLGKVYIELGELDKALDLCGQALSSFRFVGDRSGEALSLNNLGAINQSLGEEQKALAFYDQALSLFRALGDQYNEATTLLNIGKLKDESGDKQNALDHYNQALSLCQKFKNPRGEAITLNQLGLLYASLEERQKGLDCYQRALSLWRELGDRNNEAFTLANLARLEGDLGSLPEARRHIETALAIMESLRIKIAGQQLRASYFATTQRYHEFYIDLLMRLHQQHPAEGHNASALQANERARARGLLEMLTEASADINQGIDATLLDRERTLQQQINARAEYQFRLLSDKHTREQVETVKRELNTLVDELQRVEANIRTTSPHYAELKYPQPLSLKEIQQLLDDQTLLLEYSLGEERSYLWAVTPTSIDSFELPKRSEIEALARQAYQLLAAGGLIEKKDERSAQSQAQDSEMLSALARILLNPVSQLLGKKRLLIVTDGALQYIPFAALSVPETRGRGDAGTPRVSSSPLIVDHEIISLPSASSLAVLRRELAGRPPASKIVAVLADPVFENDDVRIKTGAGKTSPLTDKQAARPGHEQAVLRSAREVGATDDRQRFQRLLFSRREAEEIIALTPDKTSFKALDFTANRATAVSSGLSQYRIIHFATHSLLNSLHPELSGIVLSLVDERGGPQDGFLRLHDIYNLKLSADLVVLSACQTGLGKEVKGEGLVGLTRGFMYAGAPRVMASLWKVDDRATAELMRQFYRRMLGEGMRPAAALRAAQIALLQQKRWAATHNWAGFVLQGEWK